MRSRILKFLALFAVLALLFPFELLCSDKAGGPMPVPFEDTETGLMGYQTEDGETVLPAVYRMAMEFNEHGIAAVVAEDGWVYINARGEELITPFIFDNFPDEFQEGLARFVRDGKMGLFDPTGAVVLEAKYDFLDPVENGVAVFCLGCVREYMGEHYTMQGGEWGCVNTAGEIVVAPAPVPEGKMFDSSLCQQ